MRILSPRIEGEISVLLDTCSTNEIQFFIKHIGKYGRIGSSIGFEKHHTFKAFMLGISEMGLKKLNSSGKKRLKIRLSTLLHQILALFGSVWAVFDDLHHFSKIEQ